MYAFKQSEEFRTWLHRLDNSVRGIVAARINRAKNGQLGKPLAGTNGIYEIVIDTGPGYRLYYCQVAEDLYLLLVGGIKKRQSQDQERAMKMHEELKKGKHV